MKAVTFIVLDITVLVLLFLLLLQLRSHVNIDLYDILFPLIYLTANGLIMFYIVHPLVDRIFKEKGKWI